MAASWPLGLATSPGVPGPVWSEAQRAQRAQQTEIRALSGGEQVSGAGRWEMKESEG